MKAGIASPAVAGKRAIPVFCGLGTGADAPKLILRRSEVMSLTCSYGSSFAKAPKFGPSGKIRPPPLAYSAF